MSGRITISTMSAAGVVVALSLVPVPAVASVHTPAPRNVAAALAADPGASPAVGMPQGPADPAATAWDEPRPSADAPPEDLVAKAKQAGRLKFVVTREAGGRLAVDTAKAATPAAAADLVADLQATEGVISIEPAVGGARVLADDGGPAPALAANDPMRPQQWALDTFAAESVWDVSTGENVVVAVLDTGVSQHTDLAESRILPGVDVSGDDGNGRNGGHGHGTHVAGIVAATLNNSTGIAGLAPESRILPVKVLRDSGSGSWESVASGIAWATDHGADVINMSLGGDEYSEALAVATQYAFAHDVVVMAAAGNERVYGSPVSYPAAFPAVTAVAATDSANRYGSFSNAGDYVDVSAPGVDVVSTIPGNGYDSWSGTSMATPYAAAAAALVRARARSLGRTLNAAAVADLLQVTAQDLGSAGRDDDYGHGLIRPLAAFTALEGPSDPPAPPTAVSATADGAFEATVSWTHAGTGVVGFRATATPAGGGAPARCLAGAAGRSCALTGLQPMTTYQVTVTAWNLSGEATSTTTTFTTGYAPPDAGDTFATATPMPESLTVSETLASLDDLDFWSFESPAAGTVRVSLTNLPADYDLTLYNAAGLAVGESWNWETDDEVVSLDLPAGRYVALVEAYESVDPEVPYRLSAVVPNENTAPGPPTGLAATPGNGAASVRFTTPADHGGAAITNFHYSTDGGTTWRARSPAGTTSPLLISGLVNGRTYSVRLRAVSAAGAGAASAAVTVTPRTVPGAPTGLRVTGFPAAGQATLAWQTPASNGGAAVSGYRWRVSRPNSTTMFDPWQPAARTSAVVTGRTRGARYVVQVVAVNAAGTSPAASLSFAQATVPAAVTNVRVTSPAAGRANVTWTPAGNGGAAITGYRVRLRRTAAAWGSWTSTATPARAYSGLRRTATYEVQIVAINSQGQSAVRTARFVQSR